MRKRPKALKPAPIVKPASTPTPASFISATNPASGKGQRPNKLSYNPALRDTSTRTSAPSLLSGV